MGGDENVTLGPRVRRSSVFHDSIFLENDIGSVFAHLRASSDDNSSYDNEATEDGEQDSSDDSKEKGIFFFDFTELAGEALGTIAFVSFDADSVVGASGGAGRSEWNRSSSNFAESSDETSFAEALEGIAFDDAVAIVATW